MRIVLQQPGDRHDHPRCAEAALQAVTLGESLLNRVKLAVLRHAFDGHYIGAVGLHGENRAGFDGEPIHMHRAAAALAGVATDVGPGEPELVAQEVHEQHAVLDRARLLHAVDLDGDFSHFGIRVRLR